jgi:hypothetical protein
MQFFSYFYPRSSPKVVQLLQDEEIEEYRMLTNFDASEILRLTAVFLSLTGNSDLLSAKKFRSIPAISSCPLADRIELIFFENSIIGPNEEIIQPSVKGEVSDEIDDMLNANGSIKDLLPIAELPTTEKYINLHNFLI